MDKENGQGEIIVYQAADGLTRVDVRFEGDTVWLTQAQLVDLYHSSKANISEHIKHILEEGELTEKATVRKFRTVQMEGSRQVGREISHYNLNMVIAIGYRVRTPVGTQFRQWASHKDAMDKARSEYRKYQEQTLSPVEEAYLETIKGLENTAKKKSREKKQ